MSKNARFAYNMVNFESDVRRKRFSAHAAMKRMKSVLDQATKKAPRKPEVLFLEWEQRESNPRPSACKADALNQLSYAPKHIFIPT